MSSSDANALDLIFMFLSFSPKALLSIIVSVVVLRFQKIKWGEAPFLYLLSIFIIPTIVFWTTIVFHDILENNVHESYYEYKSKGPDTLIKKVNYLSYGLFLIYSVCLYFITLKFKEPNLNNS